jgi:hypothetical protein
MKKSTRAVISQAALVACGAFLLWYGSSRGDVRNQEPARLAYPAVGRSVTAKFDLASEGRFALQVEMPASPDQVQQLHREQPDVKCEIVATVVGPDGFKIERRITSFRSGGWTKSENLFTPDELFVLPRGGGYELTLKSMVADDFNKSGAVVALERWENVDSAIGWALEVWLGYAFLATGAIAMALVRWKGRRRLGGPDSGSGL